MVGFRTIASEPAPYNSTTFVNRARSGAALGDATQMPKPTVGLFCVDPTLGFRDPSRPCLPIIETPASPQALGRAGPGVGSKATAVSASRGGFQLHLLGTGRGLGLW